jgi:glycine/D-amino acid oxidase-like deaminating enzyme
VVIVGAGGHGLATANYLAKEHRITDVGVSGACAGRAGRRLPARPAPQGVRPRCRHPGEADACELWMNGSLAPHVRLFLRNAALEFGVISAA